MDIDITPRGIAKYLATGIVGHRASKLAENVIVDHTRLEKDTMIVDLSTGLIGAVVATKLRPLTDAAVDKTADFIVAKRAEFADNKNKKTEEKK